MAGQHWLGPFQPGTLTWGWGPLCLSSPEPQAGLTLPRHIGDQGSLPG